MRLDVSCTREVSFKPFALIFSGAIAAVSFVSATVVN